MKANKISCRAIARGRVQGVGFRYTVRAFAKELNLTGYAKNLPNGSVEMELHGDPTAIEDFFRLIKGEFSLKEEELVREEISPDIPPTLFEIRF